MTLPLPSVPPPVKRPEPRPVPVDIDTARQLWWAVIGLNVLGSVLALIARYQRDRGRFAQQFFDDVHRKDPASEVTMGFARATVDVMFIAGGFVLLLFAGLLLLLVWRMRAGKTWARMFLVLYGVVLIISGVPAVFGLGSDPDWAGITTGAIAIVQAVLAAGAVYLMHRRESIEYFLPRS